MPARRLGMLLLALSVSACSVVSGLDDIELTQSSSSAGAGGGTGGAGGAGGAASTTTSTSAGGEGGQGGVAPVCGNGALDPGEECDDGNATAGDGCTGCIVDCAAASEVK